jgi:D-glycero-beta-D-manno-heptose 1-phosphate adenylyltransferase
MSDQIIQKIKTKIIPDYIVSAFIDAWRKENFTIVFTNGCFDILHRGHVEYLAKASELGDKLIIGVNTDRSVKKLKGDDRPVNDENARAFVLASLEFVDAVVLFNEGTPGNLIKKVLPDFLVKGGDYNPAQIVGYDTVTSHGGRVLTIPVVQGFSSTNIINKISKNS